MGPIRRRSRFKKEETSDSEALESTDNEMSMKIREHANEPLCNTPSMKKVLMRTLTASCLAIIFLTLLQSGHLFCILSGVLTQVTYNFSWILKVLTRN